MVLFCSLSFPHLLLIKEYSLTDFAAVIPFTFHHALCIVPFSVRNHEDKQLMLAFIFMSCKTFLSSSIPSDCTMEILYLCHVSFFPYGSSSLYFCPPSIVRMSSEPFCRCASGLCCTKLLCEGPYFHSILAWMLFSWLISKLQFVLHLTAFVSGLCVQIRSCASFSRYTYIVVFLTAGG